MKKLLAILLAAAMMVVFTMTAFAEEAPSDGGESPAEEAAPAEGESEGGSGESAPYQAPDYEDLGINYTTYATTEDYTVYKVTMTMQAGYQEYQAYDGGGVMTIHAGIGYMDPFGEGYYYAGIMYPESLEVPESTYVSSWMDAQYGCSLFCTYHTNAGDIFAWDGIYGANAKDMANYMSEGKEPFYTAEEVNGSVPTRSDALINVVSGGTGIFKGAYGILIGSTSGGGQYDTQGGMTLPQTLFKYMEGYIVVPKNCDTLSSYPATQDIAEDAASLQVRSTEYAMVPLTLRHQAGSLEENQQPGKGIGTLLPYNAGALVTDTVGVEDIETLYNVSDYVNDNFLAAYGEPEFMVFHINDGTVAGDVYAYKFNYGKILDASSALSVGGTQEATFILIVDGTDDFKDVTGILGGYNVTSDQEGWGIAEYENDLPLANLIRAEGWMKVPAESPAAAYGNTLIMD